MIAESDQKRLGRALQFAMRAHAGQRDKAGAPYVLHPIAVALKVYPDPIAMMAALLHDVVEDARVSLDTIEVAFGKDVRVIVDHVSRRPSETYAQFIARAALHPIARRVKIADIEHNLDETRLEGAPEELREWARGMRRRYERALQQLKGGVCEERG